MKTSPGIKYNALGILAAALMVTFAPGCGNSKSTTASAPAPKAETPATTTTQQPAPNVAPDMAPAHGHDGQQDQDQQDQYDQTGQTDYTPDHSNDSAPLRRHRRHVDQQPKDDGYDNNIADDASDFDPYSSLDSDMGDWIVVGGDRYFVPSHDGDRDWQPYQHGYWNYDVKFNWTWVSYDRWGDVTDHYGIWRHHKVHGWIWLPFRDHVYRPHCVTWFNEGDYVGWYPYYSGYAEGYAQGEADGFNDGYWEGFHAVQDMQKRRGQQNSLFVGFTIVNRADVTDPNVYRKCIRNNPNLVLSIAFNAHSDERIRNHEVGLFPGGDRDNAFNFIEVKARIHLKPGHVRLEKLNDGHQMVQPNMDREIPADELKRRQGDRQNRRHMDHEKNNNGGGTHQMPPIVQPNSNLQPQVVPPVAAPVVAPVDNNVDKKNKNHRKRPDNQGADAKVIDAPVAQPIPAVKQPEVVPVEKQKNDHAKRQDTHVADPQAGGTDVQKRLLDQQQQREQKRLKRCKQKGGNACQDSTNS